MLENVVAHELGHGLGCGSLWGVNNVYNGNGGFSGANAALAWQNEFGQIGLPDVELDGGAGTAGVHWNENLDGIGLTGIVDSNGRDMQRELMTGWINSNPFISDMTIASFVDIGFTAVVAVPEPSSGIACFLLLSCLAAGRRKRCVNTLAKDGH
jgi:hypothetical protein